MPASSSEKNTCSGLSFTLNPADRILEKSEQTLPDVAPV